MIDEYNNKISCPFFIIIYFSIFDMEAIGNKSKSNQFKKRKIKIIFFFRLKPKNEALID